MSRRWCQYWAGLAVGIRLLSCEFFLVIHWLTAWGLGRVCEPRKYECGEHRPEITALLLFHPLNGLPVARNKHISKNVNFRQKMSKPLWTVVIPSKLHGINGWILLIHAKWLSCALPNDTISSNIRSFSSNFLPLTPLSLKWQYNRKWLLAIFKLLNPSFYSKGATYKIQPQLTSGKTHFAVLRTSGVMAPRVESDTTRPLCVLFTLCVFVCFLLTGQDSHACVSVCDCPPPPPSLWNRWTMMKCSRELPLSANNKPQVFARKIIITGTNWCKRHSISSSACYTVTNSGRRTPLNINNNITC